MNAATRIKTNYKKIKETFDPEHFKTWLIEHREKVKSKMLFELEKEFGTNQVRLNDILLFISKIDNNVNIDYFKPQCNLEDGYFVFIRFDGGFNTLYKWDLSKEFLHEQADEIITWIHSKLKELE
jgi:hypothetical protein